MNTIRNYTSTLINLDTMYIVMLWVSLFLLSIIAFEGILAPIFLFILMLVFSFVLIAVFSKYEFFIKLKLFIFFFSSYLVYTVINHYIFVSVFSESLPFIYLDEQVFYHSSNLGLPYVSGEKKFFDLFSVFEIHELPLHIVFSASITYLSTIIDGNNTIIVQKLLSPFFGGMFAVVLYSTLKYQFKDYIFALNGTIAYGLLSAIFMYSTPLLRDIDVALVYMIFIYLFLQKNSMMNFLLLLVVAFFTMYLRVESGMVLFALTLLYSYFIVRKIENRVMKTLFYVMIGILFSLVILVMFNKIIGMIVNMDEGNTIRAIAQSSKDSIALKLKKLPLGMGYIPMVLFGQMQPFPVFLGINRPPEAISGVLWPFVFIMMTYAIVKKNIRIQIDIKVKYLLVMAIVVLFLMSSDTNTRRLMSVYPIIYITSLYAFLVIPKNKIIRWFSYYMFAIISLHVVFYIIKL